MKQHDRFIITTRLGRSYKIMAHSMLLALTEFETDHPDEEVDFARIEPRNNAGWYVAYIDYGDGNLSGPVGPFVRRGALERTQTAMRNRLRRQGRFPNGMVKAAMIHHPRFLR